MGIKAKRKRLDCSPAPCLLRGEQEPPPAPRSPSARVVRGLGTHPSLPADARAPSTAAPTLATSPRRASYSATMGRMHSNGKGMADSALPYKRTAPAWLKTPASEVEEQVSKLAKKGLMPSQVRHCRARLRPLCPAYARARAAPAPRPRRSPLAPVHSVVLQIGVILRDSHGIAQVKSVAGQKILRILKKQGVAPTLPEDLYHLISRAFTASRATTRSRASSRRTGAMSPPRPLRSSRRAARVSQRLCPIARGVLRRG